MRNWTSPIMLHFKMFESSYGHNRCKIEMTLFLSSSVSIFFAVNSMVQLIVLHKVCNSRHNYRDFDRSYHKSIILYTFGYNIRRRFQPLSWKCSIESKLTMSNFFDTIAVFSKIRSQGWMISNFEVQFVQRR